MNRSPARTSHFRGRRLNACRQCARNRRAIARLEERLRSLEQEVNGPPAEDLLEELEASQKQRDARWAAIQEYGRLQQEEFHSKLPWLREIAEKNKAKYEAFMKERGFEP